MKPKTYSYFNNYITDYNNISTLKFDNLTSTKFNLFASIDSFDFLELEKNIELIYKVLPSLKHIFINPIIHLKEDSEVLPIEMSRNISNKSFEYLSFHSEHWSNIEKGKIRPKKILTKTYQDNYSIYENIVFTKCVNDILSYIRKNLHELNDIIYSNKKLEIDLLEHTNHENYYVALGKLQSGYIRIFSKYSKQAIKLITKLNEINDILTSRLNKKVYQLNKDKNLNIKLHKSNILLMDKNYSKVYKFLKAFKQESSQDINDDPDYQYFIKFLLIFSTINFNFESNDNIDFDNLNINFKYNVYNLNIKSINDNILLTFQNDTIYKILLKKSSSKQEFMYYDELINVSDIESANNLFISVNNIDSFRRLQQVLLKGMIYSTRNFKICPFCGDLLIQENNYFCPNCYTIIEEKIIDNNLYFITKIKAKNKFLPLIEKTKDKFLRNRLIERQFYFRNITRLNSLGEPIIDEKK
jgi:hypothetical protein